ncbi:MAG: TetR/AcrR family transcriptional regulator [Acetobacteraceae bacterium]
MSQIQVRKRRSHENRHEILTAAVTLFEQSGFHQVGVEDVVRAANVTKTTLYRHFGSKDGLVVEVLGDRIDKVEEGLITAITAHGAPRAHLKAIFDYHTKWFHKPSFAGCLFYRATGEYAGKRREIAKQAKHRSSAFVLRYRLLLKNWAFVKTAVKTWRVLYFACLTGRSSPPIHWGRKTRLKMRSKWLSSPSEAN